MFKVIFRNFIEMAGTQGIDSLNMAGSHHCIDKELIDFTFRDLSYCWRAFIYFFLFKTTLHLYLWKHAA